MDAVQSVFNLLHKIGHYNPIHISNANVRPGLFPYFHRLKSQIGALDLALAFIINIPISKDLWSSSYILLTAGMTAVLVGILYFVTDVCKFKSWSTPLCILGSSQIFLYVVSELLLKSLWWIPVGTSAVTLNVWITSHFFTPWAGDLDSFYFSLMYAVLWIAVLDGFKRKGIRFKV